MMKLEYGEKHGLPNLNDPLLKEARRQLKIMMIVFGVMMVTNTLYYLMYTPAVAMPQNYAQKVAINIPALNKAIFQFENVKPHEDGLAFKKDIVRKWDAAVFAITLLAVIGIPSMFWILYLQIPYFKRYHGKPPPAGKEHQYRKLYADSLKSGRMCFVIPLILFVMIHITLFSGFLYKKHILMWLFCVSGNVLLFTICVYFSSATIILKSMNLKKE